MNGGFEAGTLASWEEQRGITVSPAAAYSGAFGAQMATGGRIDQRFKTVAGQAYYVTVRIRIDREIASPAWGGLRVQVVSLDWQPLGASPFLTAANSPAGQWTRISFSFVANGSVSRLVYENFSGGGQFQASADDFIVSTKPWGRDEDRRKLAVSGWEAPAHTQFRLKFCPA